MTIRTEGLLRVPQAAAMLGVSYQAIWHMVQGGTIDVVEVGSKKHIPIQEITDRIRLKSDREVIRIDP